ncbi:uncharacterized protein LOC126906912 [Daktulosphaira vitifoliae]|uniref:uncharacterized protein LOC126906912 n=1 Tax=Daktulosphaira vitifoliae TaxID=58002 RepID=UPI0021AA409C|nr:uncharacterized protein LOC126906912 [Daktulosphaira vitifoliae]
MKLSVGLILAVCLSSSLAHVFTDIPVSWSVDTDTLPEVLPRHLKDFSNSEIERVVFSSYENLLKVTSEFNGNSYNTTVPFAYVMNEFGVPRWRSVIPESTMEFTNSVVRGLKNCYKCHTTFEWLHDEVNHIMEWSDVHVKGNYFFVNSTFFDQGKYHIQFEKLRYNVNTSLINHTAFYSTTHFPKSGLTYSNIKASFSGQIWDLMSVNDNTYHTESVRTFIDDILLEHIVQRVGTSMQNNITAAIYQVSRPYSLYNHIAGSNFYTNFEGKLPSDVSYKVTKVTTDKFSRVFKRLDKITVNMEKNQVIAQLHFVIHKLVGHFDMLVEEVKPYSGKVNFAIERLDFMTEFNLLNGDECTTVVTPTKPVITTPEISLSEDAIEILSDSLARMLNTQFAKPTNTICNALREMHSQSHHQKTNL